MKTTVKSELAQIQRDHDGLLNPVDIVAFARNRKTKLHRHFTWDNSKAAHEYRLWQARKLISIHFVTLENGSTSPVRCWVSLQRDRKHGGYRNIADVLSDTQMRAELMEEAMRDMRFFQQKYHHLEEFSGVIKAMKRVRSRRRMKQAA